MASSIRIPTSKSHKEEKADFWEIQALLNPVIFVSHRNLARDISQELDEMSHDGIESEDDDLDERLEEAYQELQRRPQFTANKYPFDFQPYSIKIHEDPSFLKNTYIFMLLCTRLDMKVNKIHNNVDATLVFEKICAYVAKQYFGGTADSYVFGTANALGFENKVKELIGKIGEGTAFRNRNPNPATTVKDDSVDVVVWKHFTDNRIGKLIGFGQCKTGTSTWRDGKLRMDPRKFCNRWFLDPLVLDPVPLLFICDPMHEGFNFFSDQQGFIVFNRFRIMEYLDDNIENDVKDDIILWIKGALKALYNFDY